MKLHFIIISQILILKWFGLRPIAFYLDKKCFALQFLTITPAWLCCVKHCNQTRCEKYKEFQQGHMILSWVELFIVQHNLIPDKSPLGNLMWMLFPKHLQSSSSIGKASIFILMLPYGLFQHRSELSVRVSKGSTQCPERLQLNMGKQNLSPPYLLFSYIKLRSRIRSLPSTPLASQPYPNYSLPQIPPPTCPLFFLGPLPEISFWLYHSCVHPYRLCFWPFFYCWLVWLVFYNLQASPPSFLHSLPVNEAQVT